VRPRRYPPGGAPERDSDKTDPLETSRSPEGTAAALYAQRVGNRIRSFVEDSRHLRDALQQRQLRSGLYPRNDGENPWILLVAERVERRRRLLLRLLADELNIDLATSAFEMAWLATLRRWAAVVIDGSGGDPATRGLLRAARSLEPFAALPLVVACDQAVAPDIRECCVAVVAAGREEQLATIVRGALSRPVR
jgi:hypothetical protein